MKYNIKGAPDPSCRRSLNTSLPAESVRRGGARPCAALRLRTTAPLLCRDGRRRGAPEWGESRAVESLWAGSDGGAEEPGTEIARRRRRSVACPQALNGPARRGSG